MTKRVLYMTPIYPPYVGGAAVHFSQLTTSLTESGSVEKFALITAYSSGAPISESVDSGRIFRVLFSPNGIQKSWPKTKIVINYLLAALLCLMIIPLYRISLLHTHTKQYFSTATRIAGILGVDVIIDGRDLGAPSFPAQGDVFVCASRNIQELAEERVEPLTYIPVGIDPRELDVECDQYSLPRDPYLLFVGDIAKRKGIPELLKAYDSNCQNRRLIMIGEAIDPTIDPGTQPGVQYLGPRPHAEVLCYIREADLVLLPSKEEGLPRVVLESVYHDTPILCPPIVPECELYLPNLTLSSTEPEAISEAINNVTGQEISTSGFPIEDYFIRNVMGKYGDLYDSLGKPSSN